METFANRLGAFDNNAYAYHYTSAETAIRHILPAGRLRMAPLSTVNDPRESRQLGFTYLPKSMLKEELLAGNSIMFHAENPNKRGVADQASALLAARIKVLCFTRDTGAHATGDPGYYTGYTRPAMWAHYGGNHSGICLVLDRRQLVADVRDSLSSDAHLAFGNVRYPAGRATMRERLAMNLDLEEIARIGLEQSMARKFRGYSAELCLRKHPDWRQEREWRILLFSPGEDFKYVNISGSLRGVVLGAGFDVNTWRPELEDIRIRLALDFHKINFAQLTGRGFGSPQFLPPSKRK